MELEKRDVLDNRFYGQTIDQLLNLLALKATPKETKEEIKLFISENYVKSANLVCHESIKELSEKDIRAEMCILTTIARTCARDIIEGLDIEHINCMKDVSDVVDSHIRRAKDILSFP